MNFIIKYGVEAYRFELMLDQAFNLVMSGVSIIGFLVVYRSINQVISIKKVTLSVQKQIRWHAFSEFRYSYNFEHIYFFFCNHKF
jgi:hypothetical protein